MKKTDRRTFINRSLAGGAGVLLSQSVWAKKATPHEMEGPFYPLTPQADQDFDLTQVNGQEGVALGDHIILSGRVIDGNGQPIEGATVDIWQANAAGRYHHPHDQNPAPVDPNFQSWAIVKSGAGGAFRFKTVVPGAYPVTPEWSRPPHIHFKVSKAGYHEVVTQIYFPEQPLNEADKLLQGKSVEEQKMMVARVEEGQPDHLIYDIVMLAV